MLIAIVIISLCSIALGGFLVDLSGNYGTKITPEFQSTFDNYNKTYALTEDIATSVKAGGVEQGTNDDFDVGETIKAAITTIKAVFVSGLPIMFSTITGIGNLIPLPGYIIRSLQAIILISLAFALVYLYFRYKNG